MNNPIQIELAIGKRLRDTGIAIAISNNESWIDSIRKVAKAISNRNGKVSTDDLHRYIETAPAGCNPGEPASMYVWGGIFREKGWRLVERINSTIPSNRAREIKVWQWNPPGRSKAA